MDSKNEEFHRINEKTNINNFFSRLFWYLVNAAIYRTVYFLDTNILIFGKNIKDERVKKLFPLFKQVVVSENIHNEVLKKINENKNLEKIINHYNVVSINKIKERYPEACPFYYNSIIGMNNSAIINSANFLFEASLYQLIKGKRLETKKDHRRWNKMMDAIKRGLNSNDNIFNEPKSNEEQLIDESFFNSIKKKKKIINKDGKNNINDVKNLATAFAYSVFYRKNVVVVTADRDITYHFLVLIDHFIQQMVFMKLVLEKISTENNYKNRISHGEVVTIYIKKDIFDKEEDGFRGDILSHDWKKHSFRFSIKFWDVKRQKYFKPVWINFDKKTLDMFEKNHGGVTCPFVKNIDYGNWLSFRYYWPPRSAYSLKNNLIEFEVKRKENIYTKSQKIPWVIHNSQCDYSNRDKDGKLNNASSFSDNG